MAAWGIGGSIGGGFEETEEERRKRLAKLGLQNSFFTAPPKPVTPKAQTPSIVRRQQPVTVAPYSMEQLMKPKGPTRQDVRTRTDNATTIYKQQEASGLAGDVSAFYALRNAMGITAFDTRMEGVYQLYNMYLKPYEGTGVVWDMMKAPYSLEELEYMIRRGAPKMFSSKTMLNPTLFAPLMAKHGLDMSLPKQQRAAQVGMSLAGVGATADLAVQAPHVTRTFGGGKNGARNYRSDKDHSDPMKYLDSVVDYMSGGSLELGQKLWHYLVQTPGEWFSPVTEPVGDAYLDLVRAKPKGEYTESDWKHYVEVTFGGAMGKPGKKGHRPKNPRTYEQIVKSRKLPSWDSDEAQELMFNRSQFGHNAVNLGIAAATMLAAPPLTAAMKAGQVGMAGATAARTYAGVTGPMLEGGTMLGSAGLRTAGAGYATGAAQAGARFGTRALTTGKVLGSMYGASKIIGKGIEVLDPMADLGARAEEKYEQAAAMQPELEATAEAVFAQSQQGVVPELLQVQYLQSDPLYSQWLEVDSALSQIDDPSQTIEMQKELQSRVSPERPKGYGGELEADGRWTYEWRRAMLDFYADERKAIINLQRSLMESGYTKRGSMWGIAGSDNGMMIDGNISTPEWQDAIARAQADWDKQIKWAQDHPEWKAFLDALGMPYTAEGAQAYITRLTTNGIPQLIYKFPIEIAKDIGMAWNATLGALELKARKANDEQYQKVKNDFLSYVSSRGVPPGALDDESLPWDSIPEDMNEAYAAWAVEQGYLKSDPVAIGLYNEWTRKVNELMDPTLYGANYISLVSNSLGVDAMALNQWMGEHPDAIHAVNLGIDLTLGYGTYFASKWSRTNIPALRNVSRIPGDFARSRLAAKAVDRTFKFLDEKGDLGWAARHMQGTFAGEFLRKWYAQRGGPANGWHEDPRTETLSNDATTIVLDENMPRGQKLEQLKLLFPDVRQERYFEGLLRLGERQPSKRMRETIGMEVRRNLSIEEWRSRRTEELELEERATRRDDIEADRRAQGARPLTEPEMQALLDQHMVTKILEINNRVTAELNSHTDLNTWVNRKVKDHIVDRQVRHTDIFGAIKLDKDEFIADVTKAWEAGEDIYPYLQDRVRVKAPFYWGQALEHQLGGIHNPVARQFITGIVSWAHHAPLMEKDINQSNTPSRIYDGALAVSGDVRWAAQFTTRFVMADGKLAYERLAQELAFKANERFNLHQANSLMQRMLNAPSRDMGYEAPNEALAPAQRDTARVSAIDQQPAPATPGPGAPAAPVGAPIEAGESLASYQTSTGARRQVVPDDVYETYRMKLYRETLWAPFRITDDMSLIAKQFTHARNTYRGLNKMMTYPSQLMRQWSVALGAVPLFQKHLLVDSARSILEEGPESLIFRKKYRQQVDMALNDPEISALMRDEILASRNATWLSEYVYNMGMMQKRWKSSRVFDENGRPVNIRESAHALRRISMGTAYQKWADNVEVSDWSHMDEIELAGYMPVVNRADLVDVRYEVYSGSQWDDAIYAQLQRDLDAWDPENQQPNPRYRGRPSNYSMAYDALDQWRYFRNKPGDEAGIIVARDANGDLLGFTSYRENPDYTAYHHLENEVRDPVTRHVISGWVEETHDVMYVPYAGYRRDSPGSVAQMSQHIVEAKAYKRGLGGAASRSRPGQSNPFWSPDQLRNYFNDHLPGDAPTVKDYEHGRQAVREWLDTEEGKDFLRRDGHMTRVEQEMLARGKILTTAEKHNLAVENYINDFVKEYWEVLDETAPTIFTRVRELAKGGNISTAELETLLRGAYKDGGENPFLSMPTGKRYNIAQDPAAWLVAKAMVPNKFNRGAVYDKVWISTYLDLIKPVEFNEAAFRADWEANRATAHSNWLASGLEDVRQRLAPDEWMQVYDMLDLEAAGTNRTIGYAGRAPSANAPNILLQPAPAGLSAEAATALNQALERANLRTRFYADSTQGQMLLQDEVMRYMQQRAGGMGIGDYINQMVNEDRYEAEQRFYNDFYTELRQEYGGMRPHTLNNADNFYDYHTGDYRSLPEIERQRRNLEAEQNGSQRRYLRSPDEARRMLESELLQMHDDYLLTDRLANDYAPYEQQLVRELQWRLDHEVGIVAGDMSRLNELMDGGVGIAFGGGEQMLGPARQMWVTRLTPSYMSEADRLAVNHENSLNGTPWRYGRNPEEAARMAAEEGLDIDIRPAGHMNEILRQRANELAERLGKKIRYERDFDEANEMAREWNYENGGNYGQMSMDQILSLADQQRMRELREQYTHHEVLDTPDEWTEYERQLENDRMLVQGDRRRYERSHTGAEIVHEVDVSQMLAKYYDPNVEAYFDDAHGFYEYKPLTRAQHVAIIQAREMNRAYDSLLGNDTPYPPAHERTTTDVLTQPQDFWNDHYQQHMETLRGQYETARGERTQRWQDELESEVALERDREHPLMSKEKAARIATTIAEAQTSRVHFDLANAMTFEAKYRWFAWFATKHRLYGFYLMRLAAKRPMIAGAALEVMDWIEDRAEAQGEEDPAQRHKLKFNVFGRQIQLNVAPMFWLTDYPLESGFGLAAEWAGAAVVNSLAGKELMPRTQTPFGLEFSRFDGLVKGISMVLKARDYMGYDEEKFNEENMHEYLQSVSGEEREWWYKAINRQMALAINRGEDIEVTEAWRRAGLSGIGWEMFNTFGTFSGKVIGKDALAVENMKDEYLRIEDEDERYNYLETHPALQWTLNLYQDPIAEYWINDGFTKVKTASELAVAKLDIAQDNNTILVPGVIDGIMNEYNKVVENLTDPLLVETYNEHFTKFWEATYDTKFVDALGALFPLVPVNAALRFGHVMTETEREEVDAKYEAVFNESLAQYGLDPGDTTNPLYKVLKLEVDVNKDKELGVKDRTISYKNETVARFLAKTPETGPYRKDKFLELVRVDRKRQLMQRGLRMGKPIRGNPMMLGIAPEDKAAIGYNSDPTTVSYWKGWAIAYNELKQFQIQNGINPTSKLGKQQWEQFDQGMLAVAQQKPAFFEELKLSQVDLTHRMQVLGIGQWEANMPYALQSEQKGWGEFLSTMEDLEEDMKNFELDNGKVGITTLSGSQCKPLSDAYLRRLNELRTKWPYWWDAFRRTFTLSDFGFHWELADGTDAALWWGKDPYPDEPLPYDAGDIFGGEG